MKPPPVGNIQLRPDDATKVAALIEGVLKTMLVTKLKIAMMIGVLVAAVSGAAGLLYGTQGGDKEETKPKNDKLQKLLKEKLEIIQQMADHVKQLHEQSVASEDELRAANLRVSYAKLDLCDTAKERIGVLEKIVDLMKETEKTVSQRARQQTASREELLGAKLGRLEAEIALEREKAKQ